MHYADVPAFSHTVIYSCLVIRPACLPAKKKRKEKKVDLFTLDVSLSLCLEYIPQRIALHVADGAQREPGLFPPLMDGSFVLLWKQSSVFPCGPKVM